MYLKTFEINVLKYMNSILLIFICTWISTACLKIADVELELSTDTDILLMVEKVIIKSCFYSF